MIHGTPVWPVDIHCKVLKYLSDVFLGELFDVFNYFWDNGEFSYSCRQATVIPIPSNLPLAKMPLVQQIIILQVRLIVCVKSYIKLMFI